MLVKPFPLKGKSATPFSPYSISTLLIVPSQDPPLKPFLKKILQEVNREIKTLRMGSWRSMIKQSQGQAPYPPLHPLYFRKPDNKDKKAG